MRPESAELLTQIPLALLDPSPHRLVRRGDGPGSVAAAEKMVASRRMETQVLEAISLVSMYPGRTSAELADETAWFAERNGIEPGRWRTVLGRRLSDAEDGGRGPIIGHEVHFHASKPWRAVNPEQSECRVSGRHAIRWWPVAVARGEAA